MTHHVNFIVNNVVLPGQYYDQETGLHYNLNRYYSVDVGRYITSDSVGLLGGINTYVYVGSNPITRFDSNGLAWDIQGWEYAVYPNNYNTAKDYNLEPSKTCKQKCDSFLKSCEFAAKSGPFAAAVALEFACVGTGVSAPVCMLSVNTLQGLSTAYLLSECQRVTALCKVICKEDCSSNE